MLVRPKITLTGKATMKKVSYRDIDAEVNFDDLQDMERGTQTQAAASLTCTLLPELKKLLPVVNIMISGGIPEEENCSNNDDDDANVSMTCNDCKQCCCEEESEEEFEADLDSLEPEYNDYGSYLSVQAHKSDIEASQIAASGMHEEHMKIEITG